MSSGEEECRDDSIGNEHGKKSVEDLLGTLIKTMKVMDKKIEEMDKKIDGRLEKMDGRLEKMDGRFDSLDRQIENINEKCGLLFEIAAADETRRVYGDAFSRRFLAEDFRGITRLAFPKEEFDDPLMYDTKFRQAVNCLKGETMVRRFL